ncbi:hypothetical protein RZS08_24795, partial [Arthrospira platensis SPKY1]|nr:hypothetical protein [Arthrospira platensis SPKY1]
WDLAFDPRELADLNSQAIRERLFSKQADLPEGVQRLPIKSIHLNKSPMVVGHLKTLRPEMAQRWGIDLDAAFIHAEQAAQLPDMSEIWKQVFDRSPTESRLDPDQDLYGGFLSDADRRK